MSNELVVKIDLTSNCTDVEDINDIVKSSINSALKDYFFTDEFKKCLFSEVINNFVMTTFKAELSVKCREIIQKMSFSDVFGYSCSNDLARETIINILNEEKDKIKNTLLSLLDRAPDSIVQDALISYINKELKNITQLSVEVGRK